MEKEYNYSLALLKILCCFDVIMRHFYRASSHFYYIDLLTLLAVPCFIIISFFFSAELIMNGNITKLRKRIIRLIMPMWLWGIFYFTIADNVGIKDLLWQLSLGREINGVLWFLSVQIIITILLFIFYHLHISHNKINLFMGVVLIICFVLQYTGINYYLFANTIVQINGSIGRIIEILPYAIIGILFFQHKELLNKINLKHTPIICSIICISTYITPPPHTNKCLGMGYQGVKIFIIALLIFILFYSLKIKKNIIIKIISNYTLGIYCAHIYVGNRLTERNLFGHGLLLCFIIFLLSLLISISISKIDSKNLVD